MLHLCDSIKTTGCPPDNGPDISAVNSTFRLQVDPGVPLGLSLPSAGVTCMGRPASTSTR